MIVDAGVFLGASGVAGVMITVGGVPMRCGGRCIITHIPIPISCFLLLASLGIRFPYLHDLTTW